MTRRPYPLNRIAPGRWLYDSETLKIEVTKAKPVGCHWSIRHDDATGEGWAETKKQALTAAFRWLRGKQARDQVS